MGRLYGPNLTRGKGGRVASFNDEDWIRAIRHGVGPDQRGLFIMPSEEYAHLSDDDLGAVIAYLKTLPAVDRERPETSLGPISRVLLATGKMKLAATVIDHPNVKPKSVAPAISAEYGKYVAATCMGCHGSNFSGGKIEVGPPDWPHAANLTPHADSRLTKWTEAEFINVIRTAKRPDGTEVNPVMPRAFAQMDELELKALWTYFRSLTPVAPGVR
jgi:cytochrome c553